MLRIRNQKITCLRIVDPQRRRYPEADYPFPGEFHRTPPFPSFRN